jgi:hypothetical protein
VLVLVCHLATHLATKSRVLPRVLFVLPDSSSLGSAVEGGNRPGSPSPAGSEARLAARFTALSAFSFASRSLCAISAEVNPAASAGP